MYQQIAEDLRAQIESGDLAPGAQLPTELELGDRYSSSRNTIRDAIKRLTSQGLVETRPGQGTFVTRRIDPFVTVLAGDPARGPGEGAAYLSEVNKSHRRPSVTVPKVEIQVPSAEVSRRLRVPPNTQVVSRHERRHIDDIPWSLQTSFYPMDFITKGATRLLMAEDIDEGAVRYLGDTIGIKQVGYTGLDHGARSGQQRAVVLWAGTRCHGLRDLPHRLRPDGTPLRVTVTVWPADRNQFIVNVGEVPDLEYEVDNSSADEATQ